MIKLLPGRLTLLSALLLIFNALSSQDFTWIKGLNTVDQPGDYGTVGVPAATNGPGAREGAATWKDAAGNFWMFGGNGYDFIGNYGNLSDLWKYTVSTNQWTFIKGNTIIAQITQYGTMGVSSPTSKPGGRNSGASWTDASGNLWLMGGYGYSGGSGLGYLNDLWKYTISTNEWTYVNGGAFNFEPGLYGTMGTPSSTNTPGARMGSVNWTDASGSLWLFGGYGNSTSSVTIGSLNDVWRYSVSNNTWTWMKGTNLIDQAGNYGTIGTAAAGNDPGSRSLSTGWTDGSGNFWMFGGDGFDHSSSTVTGLLNDLWKYNMSSNEWTWMKGSGAMNQTGTYGLQGTPAATLTPGGRSGSITWRDPVGNLWLFGGEGYSGSSSSSAGGLNDLWRYKIATNEWTWIRGTSLINQHGIYGTQAVSAAGNMPGARTTHCGWIDASDDLYLFGGYGQAASGVSGTLNDLWKYTNCYISPITMTIISQDSSLCAGESTSLTVSGSSNYLWTNNLATTPYLVITPLSTTVYTVITADSEGCRYQASFTQTVSACTGIEKISKTKNAGIYPNPSNGEFNLKFSELENGTRINIFNALGQQVFSQALNPEETYIKTGLMDGIYYYQLKGSNRTLDSGKLIIK